MESVETSTEVKIKKSYLERITLDKENLEKVDGWISKIMESKKGVKITKTSLVNWMIQQHSPDLSMHEQKRLEEAFFDEVKFGQWLIQEMKTRRANGEKVSVQDLLKTSKTTVSQKSIKNRIPKDKKQNISN